MLAIALLSSSLTAQEVGERVRITIAGARAVGQVAAVSAEGIELFGGGRRLSFNHRQIYRLERSLGVRSRWKRGLAYGAGAGVATGLALGLVAGTGCFLLPVVMLGAECEEGQARNVALAAGLELGVLAGGVGMAVGALIRRELWMPIPIPGRGVTFSPLIGPIGGGGHGGLVLGGRLRF